MSLRSLGPAAVLLAFACTHAAASRMSARVLGTLPGAPNAAEPVAGAHVLMSCPDGQQLDLGRTGSDGYLDVAPSTAPALDCTLTFARAGYKPETFPVDKACVERAANTCIGMRATAVLEPTGSAGY